MKWVFDGTMARPQKMIDTVMVKEHTACQCQCKTLPSDCNNEIHNYSKYYNTNAVSQ